MSGRTVVRGVAAACLSFLLSGCWLQPGFDGGNTRWNPFEDQLTVANVASLTEVWSAELLEKPSEPLVYGDRVFLRTSPNQVMALDAATGEPVWEQTVGPPEALSNRQLAFVEGELWFGYAVPAESDDCTGAFAIEGGTVRLDRDGAVVGSDEDNIPFGAPVQHGRYVAQNLLPKDSDGCASLYGNQILSVRDSRTLETVWTLGTNKGPVVSGDLLYVYGAAYPLAGCSAPTCEPIWSHTGASIIGGRPEGPLFFHKATEASPLPPRPARGEVRAVARTTRETEWVAPYRGSAAKFAIDDDYIFAAPRGGRDDGLHAYDVEGCGSETCEPAWSAPIDSNSGTGRLVTVAGDVVYVAGWEDGSISAYPASGCGSETCTATASIDTGLVHDTDTTMSVAGGRLFVMSKGADGIYRIKAFGP